MDTLRLTEPSHREERVMIVLVPLKALTGDVRSSIETLRAVSDRRW